MRFLLCKQRDSSGTGIIFSCNVADSERQLCRISKIRTIYFSVDWTNALKADLSSDFLQLIYAADFRDEQVSSVGVFSGYKPQQSKREYRCGVCDFGHVCCDSLV